MFSENISLNVVTKKLYKNITRSKINIAFFPTLCRVVWIRFITIDGHLDDTIHTTYKGISRRQKYFYYSFILQNSTIYSWLFIWMKCKKNLTPQKNVYFEKCMDWVSRLFIFIIKEMQFFIFFIKWIRYNEGENILKWISPLNSVVNKIMPN